MNMFPAALMLVLLLAPSGFTLDCYSCDGVDCNDSYDVQETCTIDTSTTETTPTVTTPTATTPTVTTPTVTTPTATTPTVTTPTATTPTVTTPTVTTPTETTPTVTTPTETTPTVTTPTETTPTVTTPTETTPTETTPTVTTPTETTPTVTTPTETTPTETTPTETTPTVTTPTEATPEEPGEPGTDQKVLTKQISPNPILVRRNPYSYFARQLKADDDLFRCVKVVYKEDDEVKTKRGCYQLDSDDQNHDIACNTFIGKDANEGCRVCGEDLCNSAKISQMSKALALVFLLPLLRFFY